MYSIAVIGGDGTGPEVTAEALKVLDAAAKKHSIEYTTKSFNFGGEEYLSALKLDATGSQLGLSAIKALGRFWNFLYRVPGGERLLYWWGMRSLRKRYSDFGTTDDEHGYGVVTHSQEAIQKAMDSLTEKAKIAKALSEKASQLQGYYGEGPKKVWPIATIVLLSALALWLLR